MSQQASPRMDKKRDDNDGDGGGSAKKDWHGGSPGAGRRRPRYANAANDDGDDKRDKPSHYNSSPIPTVARRGTPSRHHVRASMWRRPRWIFLKLKQCWRRAQRSNSQKKASFIVMMVVAVLLFVLMYTANNNEPDGLPDAVDAPSKTTTTTTKTAKHKASSRLQKIFGRKLLSSRGRRLRRLSRGNGQEDEDEADQDKTLQTAKEEHDDVWNAAATVDHGASADASLSSHSLSQQQQQHRHPHLHHNSWPLPFIHIVNTRFMQTQGSLVSLGWARLALFETFCFSTMVSQTSQNFLWIIRTDPHLDKELRQAMVKLLRPHAHYFLVGSNTNFLIGHEEGAWRGGVEGAEILASGKIWSGNLRLLRQAHQAQDARIVLQTRLDADDGLTTGYLQYVQESAVDAFVGGILEDEEDGEEEEEEEEEEEAPVKPKDRDGKRNKAIGGGDDDDDDDNNASPRGRKLLEEFGAGDDEGEDDDDDHPVAVLEQEIPMVNKRHRKHLEKHPHEADKTKRRQAAKSDDDDDDDHPNRKTKAGGALEQAKARIHKKVQEAREKRANVAAKEEDDDDDDEVGNDQAQKKKQQKKKQQPAAGTDDGDDDDDDDDDKHNAKKEKKKKKKKKHETADTEDGDVDEKLKKLKERAKKKRAKADNDNETKQKKKGKDDDDDDDDDDKAQKVNNMDLRPPVGDGARREGNRQDDDIEALIRRETETMGKSEEKLDDVMKRRREKHHDDDDDDDETPKKKKKGDTANAVVVDGKEKKKEKEKTASADDDDVEDDGDDDDDETPKKKKKGDMANAAVVDSRKGRENKDDADVEEEEEEEGGGGDGGGDDDDDDDAKASDDKAPHDDQKAPAGGHEDENETPLSEEDRAFAELAAGQWMFNAMALQDAIAIRRANGDGDDEKQRRMEKFAARGDANMQQGDDDDDDDDQTGGALGAAARAVGGGGLQKNKEASAKLKSKTRGKSSKEQQQQQQHRRRSATPRWLYWCSKQHAEWYASWEYDVGEVNAVGHSKMCVTPGITIGFNVGTNYEDVPQYVHDKLLEEVTSTGQCGLQKSEQCMIMVLKFPMMAIRSRTPTSAGMMGIVLNETEAIPVEKRLKLWKLLQSHHFTIALDLVRHANSYIHHHMAEIAADNLRGQCTIGHSCKLKSKDVLQRLTELTTLSVDSDYVIQTKKESTLVMEALLRNITEQIRGNQTTDAVDES